jgi:hypothetical protein
MRVVDQLSGWLLFLYLFLVVGTALPATIFPILYGFLVRWYETSWGKYLFFMGVTVGLSLDLSVSRLFLPPYPAWVSIVIFTLIFIMVWWCLILFSVTYWRGRKKRKAARAELRTATTEKKVKEDR